MKVLAACHGQSTPAPKKQTKYGCKLDYFELQSGVQYIGKVTALWLQTGFLSIIWNSKAAFWGCIVAAKRIPQKIMLMLAFILAAFRMLSSREV